MAKRAVRSIRLERAEGPVGELGVLTVGYEGADKSAFLWHLAYSQLSEWRWTAPGPNQGYHKIDVIINWGGQEPIQYVGQYDLRSGNDNLPLERTIYLACLFWSGREKQTTITDHDWETARKMQSPVFVANCEKILDECDLGVWS